MSIRILTFKIRRPPGGIGTGLPSVAAMKTGSIVCAVADNSAAPTRIGSITADDKHLLGFISSMYSSTAHYTTFNPQPELTPDFASGSKPYVSLKCFAAEWDALTSESSASIFAPSSVADGRSEARTSLESRV